MTTERKDGRMAITMKSPHRITEVAAMVERVLSDVAIVLAPPLTLLATGYILQDHLHVYAGFDPVFAWVAAAGAESLSVAIMSTQALLQRAGLDRHAPKMDNAFYFYVGIVVTVNGVLSLANMWGSFSPSEIGKALGELALGLAAIPVSWVFSVRAEMRAVADAADVQDAKDAALRAEQAAAHERERARIDAHEIEMARVRSELRINEKTAQPVPQPKQPVIQPSQPVPGRIDPVVLAAAMVANPKATHAQLGKLFGVSGSAVGKYLRKQKVNP
jgi:hypothetical protein